nr:vitellogenin receptor [Grapholitha molesta]WKE35499.1 vitellogenin receptor [Grapholitha molesta]
MFYIPIFLSYLLSCQAEFTDDLQSFAKECLGEDKFTCLDGTCIPQDNYCDGTTNCPDGSDENFCPDHMANEYLCNATHQFLCKDGRYCIPLTWVCNNEPDCIDASDEANCTTIASYTPSTNCSKKTFQCGDGTCISKLWACDGRYDCDDHSDEDLETCRHTLNRHKLSDGRACDEFGPLSERYYACFDSSFCLEARQMCDGIIDCRDQSDEGPFCDKWHTMCTNTTCPASSTTCYPERTGARCVCKLPIIGYDYNTTTNTCQDKDECATLRPTCSQICKNYDGHFHCECEPGYKMDMFEYLCFAEDPNAMLFYSTAKDIRYIKIKTKNETIIISGIKKSHGVIYDGKHLYWVETAEGHQAIARAQLQNVTETKEILVSLGLYDAGDIAVDWLGKNIYFSDASRGAIYACRSDGSICTRIRTASLRPKHVTLDVKKGLMYWADVAGLKGGHVIMRARMDGSDHELMTSSLNNFAKGLALDDLNDRLYFVDQTIMVLKIDTKQLYVLHQAHIHHPYAIAVFENTVYWSDWVSNTIQTTDKIHLQWKRDALVSLHTPIYGIHIYHPLLFSRESTPCGVHLCSHLCLLKSNTSYSCACPAGMILNGSVCYNEPNYRPQYLIVGSGTTFTRIRYDTLGNPESHATNLDIGRVQAMAYDSKRDTLYIYDGMRKYIVKIEMTDFTLGVTHVFAYNGLENVVDMDYDYLTDNLYVLDSGRRALDVFSLKDGKRALVHRFRDQEMPISFCILQQFGRLLVAVMELEQNNDIQIDSLGLDGDEREQQDAIINTLKGPRVRLRNLHDSDMVTISDEGSNYMEFIHLRSRGQGSKRNIKKWLPTAANSLAVTTPFVFWTDGRTSRLFWDEYLGQASIPRRVDLSIFPNNTHLHIQATIPVGSSKPQHPCDKNPCSHICVQTPILSILNANPEMKRPMSYKCLCPPGQIADGDKCTKLTGCTSQQTFCYKSNECIPVVKRCDGVKDCKDGEDEDDCLSGASKCPPTEVPCNGGCIGHHEVCTETYTPPFYCEFNQFQCRDSKFCLEREQVCDGHDDCPDGSDEGALCHTMQCLDTEFRCTTGNCILESWRCDGDSDCSDSSDEADCKGRTCNLGSYQCRNGQCVSILRRCDGQADCIDGSDEEKCQEELDTTESPHCAEGELPCELNKNICFPRTAWCNNKDDCPGGTDEHGCNFCGTHRLFECKQEQRCISLVAVCDHIKDCLDGSDETPEVCDLVNRTSTVFIAPAFPAASCHNGFLCSTGQCLEWREVCDHIPDCFDGSDENGHCFTACEKNICSHICQPTPVGPQCRCRLGYQLASDGHTCVDIDECSSDLCSHHCINFPGSFLCTCVHGYSLSSDRRSCKPNIDAARSVMFAAGHKVISTSKIGEGTTQFNDSSVGNITDIDFNFARQTLYLAAPETNQLIEVPLLNTSAVIHRNNVSNIGRPIKVSVDWVTGNVYFVDNSTKRSLKVCNFESLRCAKLKDLPTKGTVVSLVISPEIRKIFYCINYDTESQVTSVDMGGQNEMRSQFDGAVVGLTVGGPRLYVATAAQVWVVDPGRFHFAKILHDWPNLEPQGIFFFENYIYTVSRQRLYRCVFYGDKKCLSHIYLIPETTQAFVVYHPSVQFAHQNDCDHVRCENVCVLGQGGPKCVCGSGKLATEGRCPVLDGSLVPLFNGVLHQPISAPPVPGIPAGAIAIVILTCLCLIAAGIYSYRWWRIRLRNRGAALPVRFTNQPSSSGSSSTPTIDMPITGVGGSRNEFVNPMQYVRQAWQRSYRRNRPIGTEGQSTPFPSKENLSDTESEKDLKS